MEMCPLCEKQSQKVYSGGPHERLFKFDAPRHFRGAGPRGYTEQDYQCGKCNSKFSHSTNKNDLTWTLWQG